MRQLFRIAIVIGLASLFCMPPAFAQALFSEPREFVVDKPCKAYQSLRKKKPSVTLGVCKTYTAVGENKRRGATHAFLQLAGGANRWVDLSCGHYADSNVSGSKCGNTKPQSNDCLPFFDEINNPVQIKTAKVDMTPSMPKLNAFDLAVNEACGGPGKAVAEEEFKALMRTHPDVLQRVMAFANQRVYPNRAVPASTEGFLADLTDAWFNIKAFDHIMCGQPEAGGTLGGLHFYGRYLQLQQTGEACRLSNYDKNEAVVDVLYSMGVRMKAANGGFSQSPVKGYGLTLNAEDILKAATRAFTENPTPSTESKACLLSIGDDGKRFTTVFVRRASGIRTFYPDATPDANEQACANAVDLPK